MTVTKRKEYPATPEEITNYVHTGAEPESFKEQSVDKLTGTDVVEIVTVLMVFGFAIVGVGASIMWIVKVFL